MKWMELLKEAVPQLRNVVVVRDAASPSPQYEGVVAAAALMKVGLEVLEVATLPELEKVFDLASRKNPDGVLILSSPLFGTNSDRVAELTAKYRLPAVTLFPDFARAGGLMAYGVNLLDGFRQIGGIVAKVLDGAHPSDLPIERPSKFELIINVKTAKALGLTIPPTLLVRADEVIE
jgi:putative ABC transport system substrate-binding protein